MFISLSSSALLPGKLPFSSPVQSLSSSTLALLLSSEKMKIEVGAGNSWPGSFSIRSQASTRSKNTGGGSGRKVWRRRKLSKRDPVSDYKLQRVPFLEEQVRLINEGGGLMSLDIERLLLSEDNRFQFVNDVAAEAKAYVESNRDEYGHKKAILHVLSNRMNDAGFYRPEAYMETDPFKPGPTYLKVEET